MTEGISNLANVNQNTLHTFQDPVEKESAKVTETAKEEVKAVESYANSDDESGLNGKTETPEAVNQASGEGRMVDQWA